MWATIILSDLCRSPFPKRGCRAPGVCLLVFALFPFLILGGRGQTSSTFTAADYVKGLEAASRRLAQIQFQFEAKGYWKDSSGNASSHPAETAHGELARKDDQLDLGYTITSKGRVPGRRTMNFRSLVTGGKGYAEVRLPSQGEKIAMATVAPASKREYEKIWGQIYEGSFLEGHLGNLEGDWADVFRSVKDPRSLSLKTPEDVNGVRCAVLEGDTPSGDYTLWIDKDHGFVVRKAKVVVNPDDHFIHGKLSDFSARLALITKKPLNVTRVEFTVDHVKVTKVGDTFVAAGGTLTKRMVFSPGTPKNSRTVVARSRIRLGNDVEASKFFKLDWPDGTKAVGMDAYHGKQFVWSKGQLREVENPKRLKQILDSLTNTP